MTRKGARTNPPSGEGFSGGVYAGEPFSPNEGLVLLDNVQFIYELALARLELLSFGAQFEIVDGFSDFMLHKAEDELVLRRRLAYFKSVNGSETDYFRIIQKNRTRSVNQYLTHWIYPYKGKFHPQMIRSLLNIIGLTRGETVLDPFMGSGTTAVEAQLLGVNCVGVDTSGLCVLQSKVKTESVLAIEQIREVSQDIIEAIQRNLFDRGADAVRAPIDSLPDGPVCNFYKMAMLVAISDQARRRRDFSNSFLKNLEMMLGSVEDQHTIAEALRLELGEVNIVEGDARALELADGSIDGIITSPPYSIALDYVKNDAHSLKELGRDVSQIRDRFVGLRGKGEARIGLYNEDMRVCLDEMFRVLKSGKCAAIVIGDAKYMGQEVGTIAFVIDHAKNLGFELLANVNKIIFGLYNVMQKENILIFRKR